MAVEKHILVIGADRSVRVNRKPRIDRDEIGIELFIKFPDNWGRVAGRVEIELPDDLPEITSTGDVIVGEGRED